ncbi:ABC transporter permease [Streptococcus anginosus]|uniref:ABC transporter permease n=1 Tax=Streptococcus anginosus TaxID=1328 RepID=UPI00221EB8FC|nr:ABC transporter permease [Streptococcus anginosus]MCW0947030.1 ABC transporter permease [Streptococcus anginosus]HEN9100529.1 ABC transporter permease [Streptococcus agalactiae]HER9068362.1 ABC transporter permease [Streptococcus pyogenes]
MKNIMKKDFYQIKHNRFLLISFVAILLLGIFSSSGYLLDLNSRKDAIGIFDAMVYDSTVIVILVTIIITSIMGAEFKNRTVNNDVYIGNSRSNIFWSKIIVYMFAYNLMILIYPIAGCIRMGLSLGYDLNLYLNIEHIVKIAFFSIILNSAMYSVCVFFIFVFKDIARSLSLSIVYIFSFALLIAYGKPMGLFDKIFILNYIPIQQIRDILYADMNGFNEIISFVSGIMLLFFFLLLSKIIFRRQDLK